MTAFIFLTFSDAQIWPPVTFQSKLNSQYSNYQFTPLVINLAIAGFEGLYRLSTVYGDKLMSANGGPVRQFSISSDYTLMKEFKQGDKIGVGLGADYIGFSSIAISNTNQDYRNYLISTSYHDRLNTEATSFLSFGIQYNRSSKGLRMFSNFDSEWCIFDNLAN